ncbi:uncharacterized protein LOC132043732 isoform X3 [Lycium ferocissimum]|uniref:uncharacterized protein LOC132043732 isoform X3 n=1 Tax=Lycium ferocissimum TaxID=112874 RepID=UPI0028157D60|nr:uncharacterized protein LOC132043732 isoform X3 [Lycium ferocissimum]
MTVKSTIKSITPKTEDWICKIQVVDKYPPRDKKDKSGKYQLMVLQDEEENQIQAIIWNADIMLFDKYFKPFQTYLVSVAQVKEPNPAYANPFNKYIWTIDRNTIVEPIEKVIPPDNPLPPPKRLAITPFEAIEYQMKDFEFDVLGLLINAGLPSNASNGKKFQELIIMDTQAKTIQRQLVEYTARSMSPEGTLLFVPFEEESIFISDIQMQPQGQIFYIDGQLSLINEDQHFCSMACSDCKMPFLRTTSPRPIYCIQCERSTQIIPRIQFEVMVMDDTGSTVASISDQSATKMLNLTRKALLLDNAHKQLASKTFRIQMKRLFSKNQDRLAIMNYEEKEPTNQPLPTAAMTSTAEANKRKAMEIGFDQTNQQNLPTKDRPSSTRQKTETKTPLQRE